MCIRRVFPGGGPAQVMAESWAGIECAPGEGTGLNWVKM